MHANKLEEKKVDQPSKQQQSKSRTAADLSDTGVVNDQNESMNGGAEQHEDSFQRMYSKELDLDEDEVPIILHELNDSAIHFISRDQYERALSLLQKAQTLIDRLQFQRNPNDRFIVLLTMHNMALCFQKLGALEECALCLEASLQSINSPFLLPKFQGDPSRKLKKLKYECKAHMQVCALLSQLHRHKEALLHAEKSVMIAQYMISDLLQMCQYYHVKVINAKKNEQIAQELMMIEDTHQQQQQPQNRDLIYYDDSVSMLERTAYRILPIIQEVASRMVKNPNEDSDEIKKNTDISDLMKQKLNMKAVLGYLNQSEWLYLLNIGNIMQITPLTVHDLYSNQGFEVELTRDAILEKISFLAVSYFCISTELRFLVQVKDDPNNDPVRRKKESEFWHAKALEVSCSFLPSESPLVSHILTSYQKHHAPVQHEIPEDQEQIIDLKVIRPLPGIDICKFQPMVRQDEALEITIPALPLSPNNYSSQRRQNSIDPKATQIMSLPFSPNNQNTTNASQNGLFSSQLGNKNQTADSSSSNLVPSQRHNSSNNRFNNKKGNSNKTNNKLKNGSNKHTKNNLNSSSNDDGIEVDHQVLEETLNDDENDDNNDQQQYYLQQQQQIKNDSVNNSMLDVIPSANYKKLLNDFSNLPQQNSDDIIDEESDNDDNDQQFFEVDDPEEEDENEDDLSGVDPDITNMQHQESQEVELVMEELNKRRKQNSAGAVGGRKIRSGVVLQQSRTNGNSGKTQQRNNKQHHDQLLDISQEYIEDEDDSHSGSRELNQDSGSQNNRSSHARSKLLIKQQNNLSMDNHRMKRPQTSQGIRKNFKQINTDQNNINNNTVRAQILQNQQQQDLKIIKTASAMQIIPSADGVSPNNAIGLQRGILGNRQIHNQSMATTHSKMSKLQTATKGFNIAANISHNDIMSGNQTDLLGNSTPIKGSSMNKHKGSAGAKYNRENMNMSRANLDRNYQKTNQSSSGELINHHHHIHNTSSGHSGKRPHSKQKRIRNYDQHHNNSSGTTQQQQQQLIMFGSLTGNNNINNTNQQQQQVANKRQGGGTVVNASSMRMQGGSHTVQGFYNQQQNTHPHRSNSNQQKKQHLSNSGNKNKSSHHQQQLIQDPAFQNSSIQQIQHQQSQKYMTNVSSNSILVTDGNLNSQQRTLQDLFMIDRLAKKRTNAGKVSNTTQEQQQQQQHSFEMLQQTHDPKYNSQNFHNSIGTHSQQQHQNSNSRSKSRSKLTSSRSKDKQMKAQSSGITTNNTSVIINGGNSSNVVIKQNNNSVANNGQNNIEELKRQILLKQALLDSSKNSRRKSAGASLNSSMLNTSQNQIQNTQQKKRVENANNIQQQQVQSQQNGRVLTQQQQNQSQQWLMQQLSGQKLNTNSTNNTNTNNVQLNTHQMIKFLKDRQQQQQQSHTNSSMALGGVGSNNIAASVFPQQAVAAGVQQQVFSLNNSMLDSYPITQASQSILGVNDLSTYKLQLSKKILAQQQKIMGNQPVNEMGMLQGNRKNNKIGGQQYITETHPKQRSATPMLEMHPENNGQSRTHHKMTQQNSLGMYMANINKQNNTTNSSHHISQVSDLNNFPGNNQNLASYLKDYQSVQNLGNGGDLTNHNQSLQDSSFVKQMKKKSSKKATPKNVVGVANNNQQFSWI